MVRTDRAVNARLSLYPLEDDTTYAPTVQLQLALLIDRKAGKIGGFNACAEYCSAFSGADFLHAHDPWADERRISE